jgi:hypothetical protein
LFFVPHPLTTVIQVSTIVQFRTIDYGMESCALTFTTPAPNANFTAAPTAFPLDIYILEAPSPLNPHTLSFTSRPPRAHLFATLPFSPSGNGNRLQSPRFACPPRALLTFEVTCTMPGCHLQFLQDNKSRDLGEPLFSFSARPVLMPDLQRFS